MIARPGSTLEKNIRRVANALWREEGYTDLRIPDDAYLKWQGYWSKACAAYSEFMKIETEAA